MKIGSDKVGGPRHGFERICWLGEKLEAAAEGQHDLHATQAGNTRPIAWLRSVCRLRIGGWMTSLEVWRQKEWGHREEIIRSSGKRYGRVCGSEAETEMIHLFRLCAGKQRKRKRRGERRLGTTPGPRLKRKKNSNKTEKGRKGTTLWGREGKESVWRD
ncbi:hypothetical protein BDZ45DRAFT_735089 [Acephala macrosclerotiorum]|nr:hypothetical protein BDZ45DRAFT_735089 [Acephala macrosclerotiorum]